MKGRGQGGPEGRPAADRHGHVDPDVLAEFRAGLIADRGLVAGRRGRAITAHLSACAACAALDSRLARVSALLAAAPVPAVPDAVARRMDSALAALAAESQNPISDERPSVHPTPASVPSGPDGPGGRRPGNRRIWQARVLAPAAAVLAGLAGIGYGLSQLPGSASYSAPTAAGGAAANSSGREAQAPRPAGAATAGGSRSTFAPAHRQGVRSQSGNGTYNGGDQVVVVSSNLNYQPATWRDQVAAQLSASQALQAGPASASVTACVLNITHGAPRLLVENARYHGTPATIIVASTAAGDVAWVAGPACSAGNADILAHAVLTSGTSAP